MASISLDTDQILQLKAEAVRRRPFAERISLALAFRLLGIMSADLDAMAVLDELDYLEGIKPNSKTKREEPFRHAPLAPFWHKHFSSARHIIPNIGIRWGIKNGGNKDLTNLIEGIARVHGDEPEVWQKQLAHALIVEAIEDRTRRGLTGDWIIYAKHEGRNYYLDLAGHHEGVRQNAPDLFQKLRKGCEAEFPFLFAAGDA